MTEEFRCSWCGPLSWMSVLLGLCLIFGLSSGGRTADDAAQDPEAKIAAFRSQIDSLIDEALGRVRQYPKILAEFETLVSRLNDRKGKLTRANAPDEMIKIAELSRDLATFAKVMEDLSHRE